MLVVMTEIFLWILLIRKFRTGPTVDIICSLNTIFKILIFLLNLN